MQARRPPGVKFSFPPDTTWYLSLEPLVEVSMWEAWVTAVVQQRRTRVVLGTLNPEPRECGRIAERLRSAGVEVVTGVLEAECRQLQAAYFSYAQNGLPWVSVTYAQTLDGRIATRTRRSQWISSEYSLRFAHRLRSRHTCIMVGVGTVLADDPRLTVRLVSGPSPIRIVVDSCLRLPLTANVLTACERYPTIIATTDRAPDATVSEVEGRGAEVWRFEADANGRVPLPDLLRALGERRMLSVLVEGGAALVTALFHQALVQQVYIVQAPKILGRGIEAIGDLGYVEMHEALSLEHMRVRRLGPDLLLEGQLSKPHQVVRDV
jgi:diaminohydroxyphosphoribosylaminopyrimidine deaminase/5-amino-6-(5-phosphoribosylamino)uracil reductase